MRKLLIHVRKDTGLSVEEIADMLNISTSFYYKIERGKRNPTLALAKKIATVFKKDVEELFFED